MLGKAKVGIRPWKGRPKKVPVTFNVHLCRRKVLYGEKQQNGENRCDVMCGCCTLLHHYKN